MNSNWEGAYRVPAMFRWPGKIKPDQVSNEMVSHLDMLPTILAVAGDTEVKDKLLKGYNELELGRCLSGASHVPLAR